MKEIKAYIKPHKLHEVTSSLSNIKGLTGMSVIDCRGFGMGFGGKTEKTNGDLLDFNKCVKIEIACRDNFVYEVVTAIETAAKTGLKGDGKIYVSAISEAVRISTGQRGESAI
jgi:nitrogen regulatory protein PII